MLMSQHNSNPPYNLCFVIDTVNWYFFFSSFASVYFAKNTRNVAKKNANLIEHKYEHRVQQKKILDYVDQAAVESNQKLNVMEISSILYYVSKQSVTESIE